MVQLTMPENAVACLLPIQLCSRCWGATPQSLPNLEQIQRQTGLKEEEEEARVERSMMPRRTSLWRTFRAVTVQQDNIHASRRSPALQPLSVNAIPHGVVAGYAYTRPIIEA